MSRVGQPVGSSTLFSCEGVGPVALPRDLEEFPSGELPALSSGDGTTRCSRLPFRLRNGTRASALWFP